MGGHLLSLDRTHSECEWILVEIMLQVQILSPNLFEHQNEKTKPKRVNRKLKSFCPLNQVKTKKKGLHRNLILHSASIWNLFVLPPLFCLTIQMLMEIALKSLRRHAESQWGMQTLDGGDTSIL